MKLGTIVSASSALQKLIYQDLPLRQAYELCQLVDRLNPHLGFYGQEIVKVNSKEAQMELINFEISELDDISTISLPISDNLTLSVADVKNLQPFITFIPCSDGGGE